MNILLQISMLYMVYLSPEEKNCHLGSETGTVTLINLFSNLFSSVKTKLIQFLRRMLA